MGRFLADLKNGLRRLRRSPGFTLAAVVTLALGIGANTAAFSLLNRLVLGIVPFEGADRIVMLHEEMPERGGFYWDLSAPNYLDFEREATSFESMAVWTNKRVNLSGDGEPSSLQAGRVSWTLFLTLGVRPELGRAFQPEEDRYEGPKVAVLSHELWRGRFGEDRGVLGRTIWLDGTPHEVVGVMEPGFRLPFTLPNSEADLYVPMAFTPDQLRSRGAHGLWGVARLKPGVSIAAADQEMKAIAGELARLYPDVNGKRTAAVYSISAEASRWTRVPVLVVMGVAALVLLIVCTNVANLLLAKGLERRREMAIRSAVGARGRTLVRQMVTENLALGLLGGAAGLLVAQLMMDAFPSLVPFIDLGGLTLNGRLLAFALLVSLVATLLFGTLPAWQVSRSNTVDLLNESARGSGGRSLHRTRRVLVVLEVSLATALIVATGLMLRSLGKLHEVRPGFEPENLLTASCVRVESKYPDFGPRRDFYEQLASRVSAIPGVRAAALSDTLPLGTFRMNNSYEVEGQPQPPGQWFLGFERSITPGFFRAMGIPVVRGRDFTPQDVDQSVVIVNEHIARKHWPGESPLGKHISLGGSYGLRTVIGVVGNVRQDYLIEPDHGETYKPLAQENRFQYVSFALRVDGDPHLLIPALKAAVREVDADLAVYAAKTGRDLLDRDLDLASAIGALIGGFGVLALLLAAVGLNGVMSLLVGFRTREIGIRVALGAQARDILRMVLGEGILMVVLGTALGLAGAFGLGQMITSLLYGVEPTDATTFMVAPLVLMVMALIACFVPARRAASLEPTVALRHE